MLEVPPVGHASFAVNIAFVTRVTGREIGKMTLCLSGADERAVREKVRRELPRVVIESVERVK